MFKKLMNSYYYGKAGKGDMTPDDLPATRWQLFWEMLRVRFSGLMRLNLIYLVIYLPTILVLLFGFNGIVTTLTQVELENGTSINTQTVAEEQALAASGELEAGADTTSLLPVLQAGQAAEQIYGFIFYTLLLLIPCLAITGPATAGVAYVTRNWARDEHAFLWQDFKDAMKANWKQGLAVSAITSVLPLIIYLCWRFYGGLAEDNALMVVPQMIPLMLGVVWAISVTYIYPMMVTYEYKLKDLLRNGLLLGVARLPWSVGIRLLHCLPAVIGLAVTVFLSLQWGPMILGLYYVLIGFTLSRFVTASYTNAVFDRFINPRIEGAQVNRGLRESDPDEDEDDDGDEDEG